MCLDIRAVFYLYEDIFKVLSDLSKKYKTIILSIERAYNNIKDEKLHRKEFYLRNGFYSTNICLYDNGVEYEILTNN